MTKRTRDLERLLATSRYRPTERLRSVKQMGAFTSRFDRGPLVFTWSTPSEWRTTKNLKAQADRPCDRNSNERPPRRLHREVRTALARIEDYANNRNTGE